MNHEVSTFPPNRPEPTAGSEATVDAGVWIPALKEAAWASLTAALLLIVTYTIFFRSFHPEFIPFIDRDARKLVVPGKDLIPVSVGAASKQDDQVIIEDFNEDEAVLVLPRGFEAEDYPFIKVNLSGFTRYSKFKIIWRREEDMAQTYALEFNRSGDEVTQIAMVFGGEKYRGKIADITLLFYDGPALGFENNNDTDIVIDSIEFLPFSTARVAEQIFVDWTNPPLWQGYSNNIVKDGHRTSVISASMVAHILLMASFIFLLTLRGAIGLGWITIETPSLLRTSMFLCLICSLLADIGRWHWRMEQWHDSNDRYELQALPQNIRKNNTRCVRDTADCYEELLPYF